jgi:hypothetical protein
VYRWLKLDLAINPRYVDAHCWVFTPASFLDAIEALACIGCFPFVVAGFFPTEPGSAEFQVRLESTTDSSDAAVAASIASARQGLPPLETPMAVLQNRIAELQHRNAELSAARLGGGIKRPPRVLR